MKNLALIISAALIVTAAIWIQRNASIRQTSAKGADAAPVAAIEKIEQALMPAAAANTSRPTTPFRVAQNTATKVESVSEAPAPAPAPPAASTLSAIVGEITAETQPKRFGLDLSLVNKSSLHRPGDPSKSNATDLLVSPNVQISKDLKLSGLIIYTRDHEDREEPNRVSNTKIMLSMKPVEIAKNLSLRPAGGIRLPTNREAREDDRYITGAGIEPSLTLTSGRLTSVYRLALTKNIHQETLDRNGTPNISWSHSHLVKLSYSLTERVSVTGSSEYIGSKTYRDFDRTKFDLSEEINIDAGQGWSIDLGHSNSGDAMKPNLQESNIAFYDDEGSVIYLGVNYVY